MPGLLTSDTPGDRKEVRRLLSALPPVDRVRFLCECVIALDRPDTAPSARGMPLAEARRCDRADARVTDAVYCDLLYAASQYGLDLDAALTRLAGYVSRPAALRENPSVEAALRAALAVGRATRPR